MRSLTPYDDRTHQHRTTNQGVTMRSRPVTQASDVGNTGGANVSATKMMPTPEDLQVFPEAPAADDATLESAPTGGPIGRIVAGSLIAGLVAAIALVVGPFAGAEEHVITGSVLLAFTAAWAALAVLSARWTDQPQRWAIVPAVFMAVAGGSILASAPTGNELGWVWPPVVAALAVWMIIRARRDLRSRTRAWLLYPVCVALFLSAVGGAYETYRETTDGFAMPGRLIDVGGHKLHINCTGTGSPTVVLEPGLGEPSMAMAWIASDVAATTRVCVYDRAGRGWSESAGTPQDGAQVATDLHTMLERAGEQGPYVLAGHSAGGLYVLNFAQLYPDHVAGVALLDSMSPQQYTAIDGWSGFYEMFRRASAVMPSLSRLGLGRAVYSTAYGDLPAAARDQERAFWATPRHARSVRDEFSQIRTTMSEAQALTTLGDRPLVVLTAEKDAEGGWFDAQDKLAALSTNSVHRTLANADHEMLVSQQATAAESGQGIRDVVNAVRTGTPVSEQAG
jgi:pimeloyl-ACP methyl ester carboxylesterase